MRSNYRKQVESNPTDQPIVYPALWRLLQKTGSQLLVYKTGGKLVLAYEETIGDERRSVTRYVDDFEMRRLIVGKDKGLANVLNAIGEALEDPTEEES